MSTSQSVKEMEEAGHKQAERTTRDEQSGGADVVEGEEGGSSEKVKQQRAPPRPLDDRRPGGEAKDGASPWSE